MTAKEFDKKFWNENNPITTPLYKCLEAYAQYYYEEQLRLNVVLKPLKDKEAKTFEEYLKEMRVKKIVNVKYKLGDFVFDEE